MWGKQKTFQDLNIRVKIADPIDGCEAYNYKPSSRHPHAVVVNGLKNCPLPNLIHNAQASGFSVLFIVNHDDDLSNIVLPSHLTGECF